MGYKPVLPALTKRHCTCASRPHEQLLETRSRMHPYRTPHCAELRASDVGGKVRLSGWVHRKRDHGNLLFVALRDHHGITQLVADVDSEAFALIEGARAESVLTITGEVVARTPETPNPNMPTGDNELRAREVHVQSAAAQLRTPVAAKKKNH